MNIVMMTNTFAPHVGGVARSIQGFADALRENGHRVLIIAPRFENAAEDEEDLIRVPAIQQFNSSDFSVALPLPGHLYEQLREFKPDIIHSHHPFLLGVTAMRLAHMLDVPLVFTNHTRYEDYTHYLPGDSELLKRFVIELATHYANTADHIIAPSASIAQILRSRGVDTLISVVPTGVSLERFRDCDGASFRKRMNIPKNMFIIGHLGRLAGEKNLQFLVRAVARYVAQRAGEPAGLLLVGEGPERDELIEIFTAEAGADNLYTAGLLPGDQVASAYAAMDVFAFSSESETQGMVLTEAMAAGVPVLGLDAPGVRDVVRDRENGRLLMSRSESDYVDALQWFALQTRGRREGLQTLALATAQDFSMAHSVQQLIELYSQLHAGHQRGSRADFNSYTALFRGLEAEWTRLRSAAGAAADALSATADVHKEI